MPVISFVSPKGGAGKTTAAILLATELANKGIGVTVIDADPRQWVCRWGQGDNIPASLNIEPFHRPDGGDETAIIDQIEDAAEKTPFVIIDLEGTANHRIGLDVSRSDLVIVPTQPGPMEGESAAEAIKLVKSQERAFRIKVPFAVLMTRLPAAIRTRIERNLVEQMQSADIPVFQTQLMERSAFRAIVEQRCTLEQLPPNTYKLEDAIANARSFAGEVIAMYKAQQGKQDERKEAAA